MFRQHKLENSRGARIQPTAVELECTWATDGLLSVFAGGVLCCFFFTSVVCSFADHVGGRTVGYLRVMP